MNYMHVRLQGNSIKPEYSNPDALILSQFPNGDCWSDIDFNGNCVEWCFLCGDAGKLQLMKFLNEFSADSGYHFDIETRIASDDEVERIRDVL